jgi:hypothetical protein
MKRSISRIKNLENALKPNRSYMLVVHSREEAEKEVLQYQKDHPGLRIPTVLIPTKIVKPENSGR